jgi:penicillin-binding protein 1A
MAFVGGYYFFKSVYNRAVQARRQPGSAFKPFVYLAALEAGLTPASVVDDSPVSYAVGSAKPWKPDNYDRKFRGPITYQRALEESINVATVRVQERIGIRHTVDVARRLGVESPLHENLSIALGTSDLTLLEITSAYGTLANGGLWHRPTAIRHVLDGKGKLLEEYVPEGRQAISPELAYVMTHMMRGTIDRGTGAAAKALSRPAAAKTGTTQDYSNAWFIGFTPQLATGVWVGYDRPRSLGKDETGSRVAVPIWTAFMSQALAGQPAQDFAVPPGIVMATVDLDPGGSCGKPVTMAFIAGTEPRGPCGASRVLTTGGESTPAPAPLPPVETAPAPVPPPPNAVSPPPAATAPPPGPRSSTIISPAPAAVLPPPPTPLPRLIPAPTDPRRAAPVQTP